MCHSNRLTRVACWLADYLGWLQFCWDFVKPPRNDEIALQHFFHACSSARIFFLFPLCCMQFFSSNKCLQEIFFKITHPTPPQELNGRPLITCSSRYQLSMNTNQESIVIKLNIGDVRSFAVVSANIEEIDYIQFLSCDSNQITENCCRDETKPPGSPGGKTFWVIAFSLAKMLVTRLLSMSLNKHESH